MGQQPGVWVTYSPAGRITGKADFSGDYVYGDPEHPYAVTSAGGCAYSYDANGRMVNRCGDSLEWYSYDLPKVLRNGTETATFSYGVDRQRYKQVLAGSTNKTIYYVGQLFEVHLEGGQTTYRHYVPFRGESFIMVDRLPDATTTELFLHRDHQGSVTEVTDLSGAVVERLAYDAWGLRRNATDWSPLADPFSGSQSTERGYTGHEHLDAVELIHMNGRVQDPRLGRFVSADPFVPAPYHTQSYDRYAYVLNNPVSLVDPSGFVWQLDYWSGEYEQVFDFRFVDWDAQMAAPWDAFLYGATLTSGECPGSLCYDHIAAIREMGMAHEEFEESLLPTPRFFRDDYGGEFSSDNLLACGLATPLCWEVARQAGGFVLKWLVRGAAGRIAWEMAEEVTGNDEQKSESDAASDSLSASGEPASMPPEDPDDEHARVSGILRDAAAGKGNFGVGSATRAEADVIGRAWVGPNPRVGSDGRTLISQNGLRQYRPPSYKPALGRVQANLEQRLRGQSQWQSNAHIDILD